jgi:hypothetical protein
MSQQLSLFRGLQTPRRTPYNDLEPKSDVRVPEGVRACVDRLFLLDMRLLSTGRLQSSLGCQYRAGIGRHTIPINQVCDCPRALAVVKETMPNFVRCSENRCPVRIVRELPDE